MLSRPFLHFFLALSYVQAGYLTDSDHDSSFRILDPKDGEPMLRTWKLRRHPRIHKKHRDSSLSAHSGSSNFSRSHGCFPNILRLPVRTRMLKKLGTYYGYRYLNHSSKIPAQLYNVQLNYAFVDHGTYFLPDSLIRAVHTVRYYSATTLSKNQQPQCQFQNGDILSTLAGVDFYHAFLHDNAGPELQVWYYLYDDPGKHGMEILYTCDKLNLHTGICDKPRVAVNTRTHPDMLFKEEKRRTDKIVNRVLMRYCLHSSDLQTVIFRDDHPPCKALTNPAFVSHVRGMQASLRRRRPSKSEKIPANVYSPER